MNEPPPLPARETCECKNCVAARLKLPAPRVSVTAAWLTEQKAKQAAYEKRRRDRSALIDAVTAPIKPGKRARGAIRDKRQNKLDI